MNWISVDDKLPECGKEVVIYTTTGRYYKAHLEERSKSYPSVWLAAHYDDDDLGLPLYWSDDLYLGDHITGEQLKEIETGNFEDIFPGMYWEIDGVKYEVVCIDKIFHIREI